MAGRVLATRVFDATKVNNEGLTPVGLAVRLENEAMIEVLADAYTE